MSRRSGPGAFVRKEILEILRDRRAVLLTFLLPILVYPVVFSFTSYLERREEEKAEERVARVVVTGDGLDLETEIAADPGLERVPVPEGGREAIYEEIGAGGVQAWIDWEGDGAVEERADGDGAETSDVSLPELRLVYHGPHEESEEARDRLRELLDRVREEERERRYGEAGGLGTLADLLGVREIDVASEEESGGALAGRIIPLILVMTLFIGGATLSTDIVAGEKERGTLETLYLTPVERGVIARAKFLVVVVATVISGALNFGSMLVCYRLGWIGEAERLVLWGPGVALSLLLILPLGALVGGVLLGISAFARSLKEAQYYMTPVMLVAFLPGLLATSQEISLDAFTAILPVANVALAIRDGLLGPVPPLVLALVLVTSLGWGFLVMRWTAGVLSREETILGFDPEPFLAPTPSGRRRAVLTGMAATVLVQFYLGQLLQSWRMVPGLVLTLWVLLPALGALTLRLGWSGGGLADVLSLRNPGLGPLLGGLLVGAGMVVPILDGVARLQGLVLPVPEMFEEAFREGFRGLTTPTLLLLVALSPGICEELVFRGAFLGLLRRVVSPGRAALVSSAFFGAVHLSIYRFLPTSLIGLALAGVTLRARSLFPAMIAHAVYNGLTILDGRGTVSWREALGGARCWTLSLAALALGGWLIARSRARAAAASEAGETFGPDPG
jgi:sodium transport system permease protein